MFFKNLCYVTVSFVLVNVDIQIRLKYQQSCNQNNSVKCIKLIFCKLNIQKTTQNNIKYI